MSGLTQYPNPDRSSVPRCFDRRSGADQLDIAWTEGTFNGGRPYRKEFWTQNQLSLVTFFFSSIGLEDLGNRQLAQLLIDEDLIRFTGEQSYCAGVRLIDDSGNDMWSLNIIVGSEDEIYVVDQQDMSRYEV